MEAALVKHRNDNTNIFLCLYKHMETFTLMQNIKGLPHTTILIKNHSPAEIRAKLENEKAPFLHTGTWTMVWLLIWWMMYFSPFGDFSGLNSQSSTKSSGLSDTPVPGELLVPQSPQEVRASTLVLPGLPRASPHHWINPDSDCIRISLCIQSYSTTQTDVCNH